jgi:hypothetical protein
MVPACQWHLDGTAVMQDLCTDQTEEAAHAAMQGMIITTRLCLHAPQWVYEFCGMCALWMIIAMSRHVLCFLRRRHGRSFAPDRPEIVRLPSSWDIQLQEAQQLNAMAAAADEL